MSCYARYCFNPLVILIQTFIVLPSLLQVSIDSIIQYTIKNSVHEVFRNLFLPAAGAFFISYTIQYALLGSSIDILRIGAFIKYLYRSFSNLLC